MNTVPFFKITEDWLRPVKANEVKLGYIFYVKMEDGTFTRVVNEPWLFRSEKALDGYRKWISELSKTNRIFFRRDRAGEDFSDMYKTK
jgi:hypothetical protein